MDDLDASQRFYLAVKQDVPAKKKKISFAWLQRFEPGSNQNHQSTSVKSQTSDAARQIFGKLPRFIPVPSHQLLGFPSLEQMLRTIAETAPCARTWSLQDVSPSSDVPFHSPRSCWPPGRMGFGAVIRRESGITTHFPNLVSSNHIDITFYDQIKSNLMESDLSSIDEGWQMLIWPKHSTGWVWVFLIGGLRDQGSKNMACGKCLRVGWV